MSANICNEHGIICSLANANGHCRVSACYNKKVDYVPYKEAIPKPNKNLVEVVRCKECKWLRYCETEDLDLYLDCDKPDGGGIPRNEEWFCADGERKDQ